MGLTLVDSPSSPRLDQTVNAAAVTQSGASALFTLAAHGLVDTQRIYVKSAIGQYNGFWRAHVLTVNTFTIRAWPTGADVGYVGSVTATFYNTSDPSLVAVSAHLPIVFRLQSDKYPINTVDTARTVSSFSSSNGYTRVILSGDIKASGSADALEQVKISGTPLLDGIYKIVSWSSDTNFVIDLTYSATNSFSGGTIQYYYGNYHAVIRVWAGLPVTHLYNPIKPVEMVAEFKQVPDATGLVTVNINEYLKKKITTRNDTLAPSLPCNIDFLTGYSVEYAESYDDANQYGTNNLNVTQYTSAFSGSKGASVGYAFNSMPPFRSVHSGSMAPWIFGTSAGGVLSLVPSKWLTGFSEPRLFPGKYFDVSFIVLTSVANITRINYKQGVFQSTSLIQIDTDGPTYVNQGIYRVPIEVVADEDKITLQLTSFGAGVPVAASSEVLTINVQTECADQSFYVTWLNNLGGFDYWDFNAEKTYGINVTENITKNKNIFPNWPNSYGEFADTIKSQASRKSVDTLTINTDYVESSEIDGISNIVRSVLVQQINSIYDKRTILINTSSFPEKNDNQKLLMATLNVSYTDENPVQTP